MINNKNIEHRPINELFAIVKNDFKSFNAEGLIDEGNLIKTVMWCNEKIGIPIREIKQVALQVEEYKAKLPIDFEKLFYVCALEVSNSGYTNIPNAFDNNFDQDIIYEASLDRDSLGCVENYKVQIVRDSKTVVFNYGNWVQLGVKNSENYCHIGCPNKKREGKYNIEINEGEINTPFRNGILYIMYIGMMVDEQGNILFPFHPMITPFYEWTLKEKILTDIIFNSDAVNVSELLKLASRNRQLAWTDAFNFSTDRSYAEFISKERKKEYGWYNTWFKYFQ